MLSRDLAHAMQEVLPASVENERVRPRALNRRAWDHLRLPHLRTTARQLLSAAAHVDDLSPVAGDARPLQLRVVVAAKRLPLAAVAAPGTP